MSNAIRVRSTLPVAVVMSEPHPDPSRPGNSPALKSAVLKPGMNEDVDSDLFQAWAGSAGKDFLASDEDVKAGRTQGRVYTVNEDEPETEYGFEPALKRAADVSGEEAAKGSTVADAQHVRAIDMRPGSADTVAAPVLNSTEPLKLPPTDDGSSNARPTMSDEELERKTRPEEPAKV